MSCQLLMSPTGSSVCCSAHDLAHPCLFCETYNECKCICPRTTGYAAGQITGANVVCYAHLELSPLQCSAAAMGPCQCTWGRQRDFERRTSQSGATPKGFKLPACRVCSRSSGTVHQASSTLLTRPRRQGQYTSNACTPHDMLCSKQDHSRA